MSIEITNYCNHHCLFCCSDEMVRKRQFIDEVLFYRLLSEGFELGVRELTLHILGEPFLNINLPKFISKAKELGYTYVYLTTNGSLATPENIRTVFACGLDSIRFSINGVTREDYLRVHGKDDFELVKLNLKYCHKYREQKRIKFNLFISFIVTNQTLPELRKFKAQFTNLADDIIFCRFLPFLGREMNYQQIYSSICTNSVKIKKVCSQPFNAICISCEGLLLPCCMDRKHNLIIANLHTTPLREAWYSSKMLDFRKMHMNNKFYGTPCEYCMKSESNWIKIIDVDKENTP